MGTSNIFNIWPFLFIFFMKWQRQCKLFCLINWNHEKKFFPFLVGRPYYTIKSCKLQKQPPEVFYKKFLKVVLKNFATFTPMLESLFNKVADLNASNFIKKRLRHRYFPVNIAEFFKNIYFEEHLRTAASEIEHCFLKSNVYHKWKIIKVQKGTLNKFNSLIISLLRLCFLIVLFFVFFSSSKYVTSILHTFQEFCERQNQQLKLYYYKCHMLPRFYDLISHCTKDEVFH